MNVLKIHIYSIKLFLKTLIPKIMKKIFLLLTACLIGLYSSYSCPDSCPGGDTKCCISNGDTYYLMRATTLPDDN